jgi:hypothetical protein
MQLRIGGGRDRRSPSSICVWPEPPPVAAPLAKAPIGRSDTTPQPTDGTGQGNVRPSQPVSRGLNALRGQCHSNAVFNRGEQARLSRGEEIRKQAECLVTHRAIPPGNTQPSRGYPPIAAMAGK